MMKHYEEDELSATSRYVFMIIRIPCGKHFRLDDDMGHIAFEKLARVSNNETVHIGITSSCMK